MAYVLEPTASVPHEIRRVVVERLDGALSSLESVDQADADDIERAVHAARKRSKEVRAVARLVRSSIGEEYHRFNDAVRDAADSLAPIRDAHAVLGTFDDLRAACDQGGDADLAYVRAGLAHSADVASRAVHAGDPRIERAHTLLVGARRQVERWELDDGFDPLAAGIGDTYRRGRRALSRAGAKPTDRRFHEWRKAVKHLWYQMRLIQRAAPTVLAPFVASLDDLAEALGDDHDLSVLHERLRADPDRFGGKRRVKRASCLARDQQDVLRRRAVRLGATIYAETPGAFRRRMSTYWDRTVRDGPELPTGGIAALTKDERHLSASNESNESNETVERERKFLVGDVPPLPDEGRELRQGYLALDGTVSVRVRDAGPDGCTLTIKGGRGAVRTEIEVPISAEQFAAAWEHTGGRRIHKTRHRIPFGSYSVELDVFHDGLHGLVLAEVEFGADDALEAFEPPAWFGREVTDDDAYTNASLAVNATRGLPDGMSTT